ncbi:uncharacterized protein LOC116145713 isoform X2 [Pistacia vera]|uniref:uncharacterized protein LOC116145713 isoform X2 n=1 Tax=Pistacia vera TaxID=55513 RepID=UPI001263A804|nr:uncharacterized protein LOC116145713 isoform X2 [Pistacia vera]
MESRSCSKRTPGFSDYGFTDILLSWSLDDILNQNLFKDNVKKIPSSFHSRNQYFRSYDFPLLEETRAQLHSGMEIISRSPFAKLVSIKKSKPHGKKLYELEIDHWQNSRNRGKEPYKTLPGDILVLADAKPQTASDLQVVGRMWTFVSVTKISANENDSGTTISFKIKASKDIEVDDQKSKSLFIIFLTNITPNKRIWSSLHMSQNSKIINKVLCSGTMVEENCELCSQHNGGVYAEKFGSNLSSTLNDSQSKAVFACLRRINCDHKASIELIWGPPGTGKTRTVSMLLFTLLRLKCRTLVCAPTNVAITEVASRVVKLVKESSEGDAGRATLFRPLGDMLLCGNNERLKVGAELEEIYLDYRIERLVDCLGLVTGWRRCFTSMREFLEDCVSQYQTFLENELMERINSNENEIKGKKGKNKTEGSKRECKSFLRFVRDRFSDIASSLKNCIRTFCTHIPISEKIFQNILGLTSLLDSFETLLFQGNLVSEELKELFSHSLVVEVEDLSESIVDTKSLLRTRSKCHFALKTLWVSLNELGLPKAVNKKSLKDFCFKKASLIFCTASSSHLLHNMVKEPLSFLVIDEAAQLKESESIMPMQLPGIKHAVLIGDEQQLPATVESNVSDEAGFGRSLFERLSSLGHPKHLLNTQYRMHPSISSFANSYFYQNQILDGPNVERKVYKKQYLPGKMFGSYSFINVVGGREEFDDIGHSRRNMVEVSVVLKILQKLYKACARSKLKLSIGIVSPYNAQVFAIQEKLGRKYENRDGFCVKVKSIDGFQGGEEDIIIISTVRSNSGGSIGFMSKPQRINVAVTRARHCLWILGNERTLTRSESVWETLVLDAKDRKCFFHADEDKDLAKAILEFKSESDELDELLNVESILIRNQRWKVIFSDKFLKSFKKLTSYKARKSVIDLLLKLSSGWRPKIKNIDSICGSSLHIFKKFKINGLFIVCTIDIVKESSYIQVLKVWDILPSEYVQILVKCLDNMFVKYTDKYINHCKEKCLEGNLEVPKTWAASSDIIRENTLANNESGSDSNGVIFDGESCFKKFYTLSLGMVNHLLSDCDGRELDLPLEVTDEQMEIILFPRSTFVLGRSGTGKTRILTLKLLQKEKLYHMPMEGYKGVGSRAQEHIGQKSEVEEGIGENKRAILRQLFVTGNSKECFAVKQHISHLKSSNFCEKFSAENSLIDINNIDDAAQFKNIPDSFVDVSPMSYPLVLTFREFLMMLDATLGNSYVERFDDVTKFSDGQSEGFRSVALQNFLRTKELNCDMFSSFYWPHFDSKLTKKLDSSRVFNEIICHIKGGLQTMEVDDGKLSRQNYVQSSESRVSSLSKRDKEKIYDIFQNYERMKKENCEFDLSDLVIDLHRRLKAGKYNGDIVDFVYIDEVQDLAMSHIMLFKYICRNVKEGFVFSGDTAQTVAKGINFRFQDIRSLFDKKFVYESRSDGHDPRKEKEQHSEIFNLSQNFCTHAGLLKLAQSIIDILYHFFPHSIDVSKPEDSLTLGEPPVLLASGNNENAIVTIFGDNVNVGWNQTGFGAEQVILVRNDYDRKKISSNTGKQALVLTIVESKGLEFQDVLLYNFFGSSPVKCQWKVIYEYMKEQDLLDSMSGGSIPSVCEAKHNVMCAELKQLYAAITCTRQRLWICEDIDELSIPIFDYWEKKSLVQVKQLDYSFAHSMQVASSSEEWKSQGITLFYRHNYEMATLCFERANDTYWQGRSKATGLKAAADHTPNLIPEQANMILREAAVIFEGIGDLDSAARCFSDLKEYERAGNIYFKKIGESGLEKAGECFCLAGQYELAAHVYAKGNFYSKCLTACSKGKLFDIGLQYIHSWKQKAEKDINPIRRSKVLNKIEQDFLESCAIQYHELKDKKSMMKFVNAFHSVEMRHKFLKSFRLFDELQLLDGLHNLESIPFRSQRSKPFSEHNNTTRGFNEAGEDQQQKSNATELEAALDNVQSSNPEAIDKGGFASRCNVM